MSSKDELGDRMKLYEQLEAGRMFIPRLPIIARIDGRAFHSFTEGLDRPYDAGLSRAMIETTKLLVKETGALVGYTQSDEISLAWYNPDPKAQLWFNYKIAKMVSQLAAHATLYFYRHVVWMSKKYADRLPTFDARCWQVPSLSEAANSFLWRELDAVKNSISMAAQTFFKDSELHGVSGKRKLELLAGIGVDWSSYPTYFQRGTYVRRIEERAYFTQGEIEKLPPKHHARLNPNASYARSVIKEQELPPMRTIKNREAVLFTGAQPIT